MTDIITIEEASWKSDYELVDCGSGMKLERFGSQTIARPEPQALWAPSMTKGEWNAMASAQFMRKSGGEDRGEWSLDRGAKEQWWIEYGDIRFRLGLTSFKHVGVFPEQAANWDFTAAAIKNIIESGTSRPDVLNMFAYTGGASIAAAQAGAQTTHLDSVKVVNSWARENAEASGVNDVRYITEDAMKFAERELRRERKYHGIVLDPPAYGRGANGEKWVLEEDLPDLLRYCAQLLSVERGSFLVLNLYSMGFSAILAETLVASIFGSQVSIQTGELCATDRQGKRLPLGIFLRLVR